MDSSWFFRGKIAVCGADHNQEETTMDATTVAVDLAKNVFEVALANQAGRIIRRHRLTRGQFERFLRAQMPGTEIVMEACGTAHHWGRQCRALGLVPRLLPVQYVRAYVRRNKSDRTDTEALLEARRCGELLPVPIKTPDQQALQALHRVRTQWQTARTARINLIRGLLAEHGISLRVGAQTIRREVPALLAQPEPALPAVLCQVLARVLEELRDLDVRLKALDAQLAHLAATDAVAQRLQTIPGVGVITVTALLGSVPHIHQFRRGRQFASWLGLTPRESATGQHCWRGRISKRGDVYLRTLLIHGARSVVNNAHRRARTRLVPLTPLQQWAVALAARRGLNKAATALANRLARIIWAVWRSDGEYVATASSAA
jgi:transposase